jgi:integrase
MSSLKQKVEQAKLERKKHQAKIDGPWLESYLNTKKKKPKKENTMSQKFKTKPRLDHWGSYHKRCKGVFKKFLGRYGSFNKDSIYAWSLEYVNDEKSAGTHNLELKILSGYSNWLFMQGRTDKKLINTKVTRFKPVDPSSGFKPIKDSLVTLFLEGSKEDPIVAFVCLGLKTGLRAAELIRLTKVKIREGVATVKVKGGGTRAIAVNEELRELIIKARRGGLNQATYLTQKLGWYLKENQIKHFTFHQLRATYATKLYETGTPYEVINQLLGHRSIETTKAYINQLKRSKPVEFVNPYN